jgi:hypothetical protein
MKQGIICLFCSPPPFPKTLEFDLGSIQTLAEIDNLPSVRLETSPLLAPVKACKFSLRPNNNNLK